MEVTYRLRTSISLLSDSSLPTIPILSIHFTATNLPASVLLSASNTSEKAPLKVYKNKHKLDLNLIFLEQL